MNEKQFESQIKALARCYGYLYYHTWRSVHSPAGFPDCVMVCGKRVIFAELKVGRNKPTEAQEEWLKALADAGQEVYLWYPEDYDEIIKVLEAKE